MNTLYPSVINSLYWSDILLITFSFTVPQNTLFFQCKKSHFISIKMKEMFDLLKDDTLHCKWCCTCSESQNKEFIAIKLQNPFCGVKFLFHKDTLINAQAILDTVCIHLAHERYKRWPVLNMVKTNLILYIFCATTVYLQYLIPACHTMFIYLFLQHHAASVFGHLHEVCCLCAVYVTVFGNSLHI